MRVATDSLTEMTIYLCKAQLQAGLATWTIKVERAKALSAFMVCKCNFRRILLWLFP